VVASKLRQYLVMAPPSIASDFRRYAAPVRRECYSPQTKREFQRFSSIAKCRGVIPA
jgi:hypothetical protein